MLCSYYILQCIRTKQTSGFRHSISRSLEKGYCSLTQQDWATNTFAFCIKVLPKKRERVHHTGRNTYNPSKKDNTLDISQETTHLLRRKKLATNRLVRSSRETSPTSPHLRRTSATCFRKSDARDWIDKTGDSICHHLAVCHLLNANLQQTNRPSLTQRNPPARGCIFPTLTQTPKQKVGICCRKPHRTQRTLCRDMQC